MTKRNPIRIRLYTTRWCGYCRAAKALLDKAGLPYDEVDLTNDSKGRDQVRRSTGWSTVPVVLVDDELVGGYTELRALWRDGKLGVLPERPTLRA